MMTNERDAGRDPARLAEMPVCRFVSLYLPPSEAEIVAMVNADRRAAGQQPLAMPED